MRLRWKIAQWFELRWWKNYSSDKQPKEYLEWKRDYWKNILQVISFIIKVDSQKAIADLGCGPAGIFIALPENKITAVDPLLNEYEQQIPFFKKTDYPNTTFIQSTIEEFTPDKKFDMIFCMNAINHVYDIEKGIQKMKDVCTDKGAIIITIDAHNFSFFKYLFRLVPGDILHPHQYDLKGYKKLLAKDGWKVSVPYLLKQEFFFNHYLLVVKRKSTE